MNNQKAEKKSILQKELSTKETLLVLGVCALVFIYGYVFIYPRYAEYKASVDNLESIENQISTYQGQINELPILEEKMESLTKELNSKSKMLSHNMEDGMFLIGLSKLMSDLNVDMVGYTVDEPKVYNTFYAIPTTLEVRGNYKNIREVMTHLEQQKNMTQILDYNMETYIEEVKVDTSTPQSNTVTNIGATQTVYWTVDGGAYHIKDCNVLIKESEKYGGSALIGTPANTDNLVACDICKPNYVMPQVNVSNGDVSHEKEDPRATGDITARFSFIMYSSENPKSELKNDDFSTWKPGKWNPFTTTTR
ncbi:MAG: type 4a pilus biogenesis protein PilO [Peptostreptococcaceae bacterium]